jgi:signal peptide peptidase-like protein 2B
MQDSENLAAQLGAGGGSEVEVQIYTHPETAIDVSMFIIWLLGVLTAVMGSYYASHREREDFLRDGGKESKACVPCARAESWCNMSFHNAYQQFDDGSGHMPQQQQQQEEEETVELTVYHAAGFIVMASSTLLLLYYIQLTIVMDVMFMIASLSSTTIVLWYPLCVVAFRGNAHRYFVPHQYFGAISLAGGTSFLTGLFFVMLWWFKRDSNWSFVLQDTFGMCLCALFLTTIRLPSIKVATILLSLAFFYDIFWVFLSPYVFGGTSVMVQVATGGPQKPSTNGAYHEMCCERYSSASGCGMPETLAMLLKFPRLMDWRGGYSMLGLGDIVLPGLVLTFALRYDYYTRTGACGGYFVLMSFGYGVGLAMANYAVYAMNQGQPALLYLVPCTLGLLVIVTKVKGNGDFKRMWATGTGSLSFASSI